MKGTTHHIYKTKTAFRFIRNKTMEKFNIKSMSDPKNPFAYHLTHNIKTKSSLKHNFSFLKMWDEWNLSAHKLHHVYLSHNKWIFSNPRDFYFFDGFPQLFHGICIYYIIRCITRIKCLCSAHRPIQKHCYHPSN